MVCAVCQTSVFLIGPDIEIEIEIRLWDVKLDTVSKLLSLSLQNFVVPRVFQVQE